MSPQPFLCPIRRLIFVSLAVASGTAVFAQQTNVPQTLHSQGRVLSKGVPFNGTGHFVFALFSNNNTINLPDLPPGFLRGWNSGASDDYAAPDSSTRVARKAGGNTGNSAGSFQTDELKSHNHGHRKYQTRSGFGTTGEYPVMSTSSGFFDTLSIQHTGGSETRGKNATAAYLIKY